MNLATISNEHSVTEMTDYEGMPAELRDCPRCDECACIYLHEVDYRKHMQNHHTGKPRKARRKARERCQKCSSSTEDSTESTGSSSCPTIVHADEVLKPRPLQLNLKTRWKKRFAGAVREQLSPLSQQLKAIDPAVVPLKNKVKMQAALQPFLDRELERRRLAPHEQWLKSKGIQPHHDHVEPEQRPKTGIQPHHDYVEPEQRPKEEGIQPHHDHVEPDLSTETFMQSIKSEEDEEADPSLQSVLHQPDVTIKVEPGSSVS